MSQRSYLEGSLRTFGSVIIRTNYREQKAQLSPSAFENPEMAKDIVDLIYGQVTPRGDEYIVTIVPDEKELRKWTHYEGQNWE